MQLIVIIIGLMAPRFVIMLLWLFSDWFAGVFDAAIVPVLGFLFLPYTLLWFSAVQNYWGGVWGFWQIAFALLALCFDLGAPYRARRHE